MKFFSILFAVLAVPSLQLGTMLAGQAPAAPSSQLLILAYGPAMACGFASLAFACFHQAMQARKAAQAARNQPGSI
jgi:hypothetical protein